MREGLHYKNERSLVFSIFLDRMQKMFNIYEEEGEEFTENAKLRELFKQVQHPQLQDTVKALKFALTWKVSLTPRQQITLLPRPLSSQSTTSLARFQPHHLEHQGLGAVGATTTIVISRKRGECKPRTKAYLCQTDRFYRVLPKLVGIIKRRQAAHVGFTKQEKEGRCWQQVTNFRRRFHRRATTSHETYHFRVDVVKE